MCSKLRNTFRRGRPAVPLTLRRTRFCRRDRISLRLFGIVQPSILRPFDFAQGRLRSGQALTDLTGLAGLAANHFVLVANALALVRLRRPQLANQRRDVSHLLAIRALDGDRARLGIGAELDSPPPLSPPPL